MSIDDIRHSNPRKLEPYERANDLRVKEIDGFLWLNGIYMSNAVASCMTKHKYPKEPLYSYDKDADVKKKQEMLLMSLCAMQKNYEIEQAEKKK